MPDSGISTFWIFFFSTYVILNYTGKQLVSPEGPSVNYVRNFTCYLDPLPPFLHVIRNRNV